MVSREGDKIPEKEKFDTITGYDDAAATEKNAEFAFSTHLRDSFLWKLDTTVVQPVEQNQLSCSSKSDCALRKCFDQISAFHFDSSGPQIKMEGQQRTVSCYNFGL